MRMLRTSSDQEQASPTKQRRRFRRQRSEHIVPMSDQVSSTELIERNLSPQLTTHISQELQSFNTTVSARPNIELDQLNQRQLLLQALVASSTSNGNGQQKLPIRETPSPATSSLSSTTSSSHASSLENFRENISRGYST